MLKPENKKRYYEIANRYQNGESCKAIAKEYNISHQRVYQIVHEIDQYEDAKKHNELFVFLHGDTHSLNCLERAGIITVQDLLNTSHRRLKTLRSLGSGTYTHIMSCIDQHKT